MKTGAKIAFFGCGGMLLLVIILVAILGFWMSSVVNQPEVTAVIEHAREYGKTTDKQGCIDEGLRRAEKLQKVSPRSIEFWAESSWASNCLDTAAETEDFCRGVPTIMEEFRNTLDEKVYEEQMCKKTRFGQYDVHCKSVYSAKQKSCW